MIRVPIQQEARSAQNTTGPSGPPEPQSTPPVQGLTVMGPKAERDSPIQALTLVTPEPDETVLKHQAAADVARDLQAWKTATAAWQTEYMNACTGPDARNAVQEARAFHEEQFKPLQGKYAQNPISLRYLHEQGKTISKRGIGFMNAYAQGENKRFVESVLAEEEKELRELMNSAWSTDQDRKEAFASYAFKAENWRLGQGESPETVKAWKNAFSREIAAEALHARFDRILDQDPDQALRLVRIAKIDAAASSDSKTGSISLESLPRDNPSALLSSSVDDEQDNGQEHYSQLRKMASEYAVLIPSHQLQLMQNRAEAEKQNRLRLLEERTVAIHSGVTATMLCAVDGGDLSSLRTMADELAHMGKTLEAQAVTAMRQSMAQAQPYLASSRFEPFSRQRSGLREFFARPETQAPGNDPAWSETLAIAERGIAERESRFIRDPAGYAASHPLLSREGMSAEEFRTQEGIRQEEHITRSLRLQEHMGQGMNINPRVLSEARAAKIKDRYEAFGEAHKKAELLRQLAADSGKYAPRVMAEAGLPMGVSAFAQVLPELSMSESTKLTQAAETTLPAKLPLERMDLPDARKTEIKQRVAGSALTKALLSADALLESALETGEPSPAAQDTVRTLENFVALGGNLPDLERRVLLGTSQPTQDIAIDLLRTAQAALAPSNQTKPAEQWETIAQAISTGNAGAIYTVWGTNTLMTQKTALSAPALFRDMPSAKTGEHNTSSSVGF